MDTKQNLINQLTISNNFQANNSLVFEIITKLDLWPTYPIILVGGTNGKGSTTSYLNYIYQASGYKVGTFTSPHVLSYNERISFNNQIISDADLVYHLNFIIKNSTSSLGIFKTFFLASLSFLKQQQPDLAVYEVGIGGKEDITNLLSPILSIITSVNLDHTDLLGSSIEEIGLNKAHIYRTNQPAFFGAKAPPLSLTKYAKAIKAELYIAFEDYYYHKNQNSWNFFFKDSKYYTLPYPHLKGENQLKNAATALAAITVLNQRFPVVLANIKTGLLKTNLLGRFQVLAGYPQFILEVAHNPAAIESMLQNMLELSFVKKTYAVLGINQDKDWKTILKLCHYKFNSWYLVNLPKPRGEEINKIKDYLLELKVPANSIFLFNEFNSALEDLKLKLQKEDRVIAFGSFITVEHVYKWKNNAT